MANTYTQLHHQFVFATKYRKASIHSSWKDQLHKYITAIVQDHHHKMLQINTMPDHLHMLIGMRPTQSISSLIQIVKSESTKWVKDKRFCDQAFAWQEGFGAFSYSKSQIPRVILYIQQQEAHHRKKTFLQEYIRMLSKSGIEFDEHYIFKEPV
jgi:REP element-mobilizing transposase RayT